MISKNSVSYWGGVASILALIIMCLIEPARKFCGLDNLSWGVYVVCLLVFLLGVFTGILIPSRPKKIELKRYRNRNEDLKRYSIVVVDDLFDDTETQESFMHQLSNYDVFCTSSVNSVKQLIGFDIIVMDIMGVSQYFTSGSTLIDDLFRLYPEKYLIAISSSNRELLNISKHVDDIVGKINATKSHEAIEDLTGKLSEKFRKAFKVLDNPQAYWDKIYSKLNGEDPARKKAMEKAFYYSILTNPSYSIIDNNDGSESID